MAAEKMDHRAAANCAFIGAALFLLSAILFGTGFGIEFSANVAASETHIDMMNSTQRRADFNSWQELDVTVLKRRWEGRIASQTPHLLAELIAAVAWFTTLPAVSSAALVAGGNSRSATRVMYNAFVAIAAISTVDFTFQAGTVSMTDWLATWPVMDANHTHDGGFGALQALELDFLVSSSRTVWLFALDDLLLAIALVTAAFLTYTGKQLNRCWAHYSVAIAGVSAIGFCLMVFRLVSWRYVAMIAGLVTGITDAILLPIWMVALGIQLRRISNEGTYAASMSKGPANDVEMNAGNAVEQRA